MSTLAALWRSFWSRPWLVLGAMAVFFGTNAVAARFAVGEISPLVLVLVRWAFTLIIVALMFKREDWRELRGLIRSHWFLIGWMGLVGCSGFNALFYVAANWTTAVNMVLLQSVVPALVLAGAALIFHIKIHALQIIGMTITFLGALVVASGGEVSRLATFSFSQGEWMILLACAFYAAFTLGLRVRPRGSPLVFFAGMALASFFWTLPMTGIEILTGHAFVPSLKGWLITLFIAIVPSVGGTLFYTRGVDLIGPARAGLFINLVPIFGALTAVIVLHETFTLAHAVALVLTLGGISLAEWRGPRRSLTAQAVEATDPRLP